MARFFVCVSQALLTMVGQFLYTVETVVLQSLIFSVMSCHALPLEDIMLSLATLKTRNDLATFLGLSPKELSYILYAKRTENYYTTFDIPKKAGGYRTISAPQSPLKEIQRLLAASLSAYYDEVYANIYSVSHGFHKKRSICTNASKHRNKRYVLNIDLEHFFESFHFGRVLGFFEKNRHFALPHEVAVAITQLCCYNGALPQGAPTSPIITDFICRILDSHLIQICKKYRLTYTRYVDDLTFSTNRSDFPEIYEECFTELEREIIKSGFHINHKKTRLQFFKSRQEVTGLTVNKKIGVKREFRHQTRAMLHNLFTQGSFFINGDIGTLQQLEGRLTFIDQIDHFNNGKDKKSSKNQSRSSREKSFGSFLFYRYFYNTEKPVILTEGKTDILYIKAALKNLYADYPNLVERDEHGNFHFKIDFLSRTKRWKFFFDAAADGGDALRDLLKCFTHDRSDFAYYKYLKKYPLLNVRPIIILLDNEQHSDKPLKKFISSSKDLKVRITQKLDKGDTLCEISITPPIYLVVPELPAGFCECEIEDLFSRETLSTIIDGREFRRDGPFENHLYYTKFEFAKYIYAHYSDIDFSHFRPILDNLSRIVINRQ